MFGLSINTDASFVANLPADMTKLIARMMNYASNLHDKTKDLVVQLMKAIAGTERTIQNIKIYLHHIQGRMGILLLNPRVLVFEIIQVSCSLIAPPFVSLFSHNPIFAHFSDHKFYSHKSSA
jgi:hypothetical protein